jgi:hypothetical protein
MLIIITYLRTDLSFTPANRYPMFRNLFFQKFTKSIIKKGQSYITIGEPWNFTSPDGQNLIKGTITKVVNSSCLLFQSNHVLTFREGSGNFFVLFPRHAGYNFGNLGKDKNGVSTNGCLLFEGLWNNNMTPKELETNSKFVLIGSIHLNK